MRRTWFSPSSVLRGAVAERGGKRRSRTNAVLAVVILVVVEEGPEDFIKPQCRSAHHKSESAAVVVASLFATSRSGSSGCQISAEARRKRQAVAPGHRYRLVSSDPPVVASLAEGLSPNGGSCTRLLDQWLAAPAVGRQQKLAPSIVKTLLCGLRDGDFGTCATPRIANANRLVEPVEIAAVSVPPGRA